MKSKKIKKKLTLNKITISSLNERAMNRVYAGAEQTEHPVCPTMSCPSCDAATCESCVLPCVDSIRICYID